MYIAFSQRDDTRRAREDERFERAISRIGSTQVAERLTGIAGLEQFLKSKEPDRQAKSLQYLVNAAVIEPDVTVRSAIVDVFAGLEKSQTAPEALQIALISSRDRNRAILKRYVDDYFAKAVLVNNRLPSGPEYTEVPIGKLSAEQRAPLETTATIIAALIRAGGKVSDLTQICCVECKFSLDNKSVDLSGTKFDGSFLRRADFKNANLAGSSFHNSDLVQTWFTSANLHGSKLTADIPVIPWQEMAGIAGDNLLLMFGANFACADLSEADFTGRPIFTFIYNNPVIGSAQHDNFAKANLRRTKLTGFQFLLGVPAELLKEAKDPAFFDIHGIFPVTTGQWGGPSQTIKASGGKGKDYVVWTVATNADFRFTGNIDTKAFWDVVLAFRQLHNARNLMEADMPVGLKSFIQANEKLFSPVLGDPGCTLRGE
jgi:uncharacterized protein YjbI with pentapeptide repeats